LKKLILPTVVSETHNLLNVSVPLRKRGTVLSSCCYWWRAEAEGACGRARTFDRAELRGRGGIFKTLKKGKRVICPCYLQ